MNFSSFPSCLLALTPEKSLDFYFLTTTLLNVSSIPLQTPLLLDYEKHFQLLPLRMSHISMPL